MAQKCFDWFLMGLFFGLGWALVNGLTHVIITALSDASR